MSPATKVAACGLCGYDKAPDALGCPNCLGEGLSKAKTVAQRVATLRASRDSQGLKRLELYAHPDDWAAIKALAEKLHRKRQKHLTKDARGLVIGAG